MFVFCFAHTAYLLFHSKYLHPFVQPLIESILLNQRENNDEWNEMQKIRRMWWVFWPNGICFFVDRLSWFIGSSSQLETLQCAERHFKNGVSIQAEIFFYVLPVIVFIYVADALALHIGKTEADRCSCSIWYAKSKIKQNSIMKFTKTAQIIK